MTGPNHPTTQPPNHRTHLFLFDVDGVLVDARGYLRALQDTVAHFARRMGVGDPRLTEDEVRAGEAHGLTSEWDSAPAYILTLLVERLRREPSLALPARWDDALDVLATHPLSLSHPDYMALVARIGARRRDFKETSHAVRAVLWDDAQVLPAAQCEAVSAILDELLADTHAFACAPITQHFQHLVIGSEGVAKTYGIAPYFEARPYLLDQDVAELTPEIAARLRAAAASGDIHPVIYTARPSLPPRGAATSPQGYSPEAELAQTLVGLEGWPVIGLGRLQWLAARCGGQTAQMVKPSPVQALAAIGAAVGPEVAALEAAWDFHTSGELRGPLADLGATTVHIFEDTVGGMGGVRSAVELLQAAGVDIHWQPYGITPATGAKAEAMAAQGIPTYRSVNDAVAVALEEVIC
jgi:phosphoglycolate phosphatase-like HAD superfamily hydrolase